MRGCAATDVHRNSMRSSSARSEAPPRSSALLAMGVRNNDGTVVMVQ